MLTRQLLELHGYSPDELIGQSIMFLDPHIGEQKVREIAAGDEAGKIFNV